VAYCPRPKSKTCFPAKFKNKDVARAAPEVLRGLVNALPKHREFWNVWKLELLLCGAALTKVPIMEKWLSSKKADDYIVTCANLIYARGMHWADCIYVFMDDNNNKGGMSDPLCLIVEADVGEKSGHRTYWSFLSDRQIGGERPIPSLIGSGRKNLLNICQAQRKGDIDPALTLEERSGPTKKRDIPFGRRIIGPSGEEIELVDWQDHSLPIGRRLQSKAIYQMDVDPEKGTVHWKQNIRELQPVKSRGPLRPGDKVTQIRLPSLFSDSDYTFRAPKIIWAYLTGEVPARITIADNQHTPLYQASNLVGHGWIEDASDTPEIQNKRSMYGDKARKIDGSQPLIIKRQRQSRSLFKTKISYADILADEEFRFMEQMKVRLTRQSLAEVYNWALVAVRQSNPYTNAYSRVRERNSRAGLNIQPHGIWCREQVFHLFNGIGVTEDELYEATQESKIDPIPLEASAMSRARTKQVSLQDDLPDDHQPIKRTIPMPEKSPVSLPASIQGAPPTHPPPYYPPVQEEASEASSGPQETPSVPTPNQETAQEAIETPNVHNQETNQETTQPTSSDRQEKKVGPGSLRVSFQKLGMGTYVICDELDVHSQKWERLSPGKQTQILDISEEEKGHREFNNERWI